MKTYSYAPGERLESGISKMISMASQMGETVSTENFGGFTVNSDDQVDGVVTKLQARDCAAYEAEAVFTVADAEYFAKIRSQRQFEHIVHAAGVWARLVEVNLAAGQKLPQAFHCVNDMPDMGGIGFATAVKYLSRAWIHGKELKTWFDQMTEI